MIKIVLLFWIKRNKFSPLKTHPPALNIVWGQVGAGIVVDSAPEREWYESLHKAQAQLAALKMLDNQ